MGLDYYRVLFISRDASETELKQAYKKMSLLHHPKRQKVERPLTPSTRVREQVVREQQRRLDSIQMFHIVSEAYDVLSNPLHRAIYDTYGEKGLKEGLPSPSGFIQPYAYHGDPNRTFREFFGTDNPFVDILSSACVPVDFFAGTENAGFKSKERPVYRDVILNLEEAYTGCTKKVLICKKIISPDGNSVSMTEKILTINVQPGTPAGAQYVFPNEGDQGPNIQPADIIFLLHIKKHPVYVLEGNNLVINTTASLCQALTGLTMPITTLDDRRFNVAIVHIIHPGYEKIIRNEGMPIYGESGTRGDLIIRFTVSYPNTLSQSQKKITKDALDCESEEKVDKSGPNCYSKRQPVTLTLPSGCICPPPQEKQEQEKVDVEIEGKERS